MHILLLNGNAEPHDRDFDKYIASLVQALQSRHTITLIALVEQEIAQCTGCFNCWIRTPGECTFTDAAPALCREYLEADLVLLASPIVMGFTSALLKRALERLLPLLHPHLEVSEQEARQKLRYQKQPVMALLLGQTKTGDKADIRIITEIYRRTAAYFNTSLAFVKLTADPVKEVVHAVNSL